MEGANYQTQIIEKDLNKLGERFDRHLEIYAQNGKELASLKTSVEGLRTAIYDKFDELKEYQNNQAIQIKDNSTDIKEVEINVSKLAVKLASFAAIASAVASSIVVVFVQNILL